MMKIKIPLLIIIFMLFLCPLFAEEGMTITTYYPSPVGIYRDLQASRMAIGDINNDKQIDANDLPSNPGDLAVAGMISASRINSNLIDANEIKSGKIKSNSFEIDNLTSRSIDAEIVKSSTVVAKDRIIAKDMQVNEAISAKNINAAHITSTDLHASKDVCVEGVCFSALLKMIEECRLSIDKLRRK